MLKMNEKTPRGLPLVPLSKLHSINKDFAKEISRSFRPLFDDYFC